MNRIWALFFSLAVVALPAAAADQPDDLSRAATALEQAVKADPNNSELWTHLGFAYRKMGKIQDAANAFDKAATLNPHSKESLYMLALIFESKHQKPDAVKTWKEYLAVETDPSRRAIAETHIHHLSE